MDISVDVGMTEDEFIGQGVADISDIKLLLFLGNLRIEGYMKQNITKFLADIRSVIGYNCVGEIVDLF